MSRIEKLIERLKTKPKDLTYEETEKILNSLGFFEYNKGRTSGSRVEFKKNNKKIQIHKPHPGNILKPYQVKIILNKLKELGEI